MRRGADEAGNACNPLPDEETAFLAAYPDGLALYKHIRTRILSACPNVEIRVRRTQIGFFANCGFAYVWYLARKPHGVPTARIMLGFVLDEPLESPRFSAGGEMAPNRWAFHLPVHAEDDLDDEVMSWIWRAYQFACRLPRGRKPRRPFPPTQSQ